MSFSTYVVGLNHYPGFQECEVGDALALKREPNNPYDENAIAVYTFKPTKVGYIRRQVAELIAPRMDNNDILIGEVLKKKRAGFFQKLLGEKDELFIEVGTVGHFAKKHNWPKGEQKKVHSILKEILVTK